MSDPKTTGGAGRSAAGFLSIALLCTAIGLVAGWLGGSHGASGVAKTAGHDDHAHGTGAAHDHAHGAGEHPRISAQTVANLKITTAAATKSRFQKFISIPAVIVEAPRASLPLYAPRAGRVLDLRAVPGSLVEPCALLVTILRDAIPRPVLTVTGDVLKPAQEETHRSLGELRKASRNLDLARAELARIRKFTETGTQDGLPLLPRKNVIDLEYEVARIEKDAELARGELKRHGLTDEEVQAAEAGSTAPMMGLRFWRRSLEQAGLWTAEAQAIEKSLPEDLRVLPWAIATIAELAAAGLATTDLTAWLQEDPAAAKRFLEIAALLQQGETLSRVRQLHEQGALDSIIEVKAPGCAEGKQWDVSEVVVKPGEHVDAGARLVVLNDATAMYLRAFATGSDTAALLDALKKDVELSAAPLSATTAPMLKGLRITRVAAPSDKGESEALLWVANEVWVVHGEAESRRFRTWRLRTGQKYMLRVPTETFEDVFVLPADAVADEGADRIVFVAEGGAFEPAKVVVLYQDDEVAIVDPSRSEVAVGADVVQTNAFGLSLAFKAMMGQGIDPHAGHHH